MIEWLERITRDCGADCLLVGSRDYELQCEVIDVWRANVHIATYRIPIVFPNIGHQKHDLLRTP